MIRSGQPLACSTAPVDHVGRELASTSRPAEERAEQVRSATVVQPECLIGEVVVRTERWDAGKSCSPPTRWNRRKAARSPPPRSLGETSRGEAALSN